MELNFQLENKRLFPYLDTSNESSSICYQLISCFIDLKMQIYSLLVLRTHQKHGEIIEYTYMKCDRTDDHSFVSIMFSETANQ